MEQPGSARPECLDAGHCLRPGNRLILERNPYYYAVDTAGNQLPYIDRMEVTFSENAEVLKLRIFNGDVNFHAHPHLSLRDLAVLKENESNGDYRVLLWDNGAGGAPAWGVNWNNPDDAKRAVVRTTQYRRALSHAMDRERIRKITFLGLGEAASTGTMSPNSGQFNRTERGQQMLIAWRDSAVTYDPELAASLLDEIDVTDKDGDGFRDLPDGSPLEVRIDFPAGNTAFIETAELMTEDWKAIGLNAFVNSIPGAQLGVMTTSATYDIRLYGGGAPDGPICSPILPGSSLTAAADAGRPCTEPGWRLKAHPKRGPNWTSTPATVLPRVRKSRSTIQCTACGSCTSRQSPSPTSTSATNSPSR